MANCNACGELVHPDLMARADEYNVGGDTICLACHAECVPEDRQRIVDHVVRLVRDYPHLAECECVRRILGDDAD